MQNDEAESGKSDDIDDEPASLASLACSFTVRACILATEQGVLVKPQQQSAQQLHLLLSRASLAGGAEVGAAASAAAVLLVERLAAGLTGILLLPPEPASQPEEALSPCGDRTATTCRMGPGPSPSSVCLPEHVTLAALSTAGPESVGVTDHEVSHVLVLLSSVLASMMTDNESNCREIESLLPRLAVLMCSYWDQVCRPVLDRAKDTCDVSLGGDRSAPRVERQRRVGASMEGVLQQLKHAAQAATQQTQAQAPQEQKQQQQQQQQQQKPNAAQTAALQTQAQAQRQQQPNTAVAAMSPGSLESLCLPAAVAMAGALCSELLLRDAVSAADLAKEGLQELLKIRMPILRLQEGAVPVLEAGIPMSQGPCVGPVELKDRAGPASSQLLQVDAPPPPPPPPPSPSSVLGTGAALLLPHADASTASGQSSAPLRIAGRRLRYLRKELVGLRTSCQPNGELAEALSQDDNLPFMLPVQNTGTGTTQ